MNESDTLPNREDIDQTPKINSPKPRDNNVLPVKTPPAVVNKAIFLCDSNGKFLDKRKLFPPGQDFTFYRSPTLLPMYAQFYRMKLIKNYAPINVNPVGGECGQGGGI